MIPRNSEIGIFRSVLELKSRNEREIGLVEKNNLRFEFVFAAVPGGAAHLSKSDHLSNNTEE